MSTAAGEGTPPTPTVVTYQPYQRSFPGKVWRFLVGIKDALALLFLLLFFAALFMILGARPSPGVVRDGALLLQLDGSVVEEVSPIDPLNILLPSAVPTREYAAREVVRAIDDAAGDERIKAIALDLSGVHRRRPRAHADDRRRARPVPRDQEAGARLRGRLQRRFDAARGACQRSVGRSDGRHRDHRAGRRADVLRRPAREARGDRARVPRRHLQERRRTLPAERDVARGARELSAALRRAVAGMAGQRPPRATEGERRAGDRRREGLARRIGRRSRQELRSRPGSPTAPARASNGASGWRKSPATTTGTTPPAPSPTPSSTPGSPRTNPTARVRRSGW